MRTYILLMTSALFAAPVLADNSKPNIVFILPGSLDMYPYAFARNNVWQGEVTAQKGWSAFNRVSPAAQEFKGQVVLETFYRESGPENPLQRGPRW